MKKKPNINYEEQEMIDKLVEEYQAGNEEAGMELLTIYGADPTTNKMTKFIGKYYKILRYGKLDFKDYDSRYFMSLFFKGEERKAILQSYQHKKTKEDVTRRLGFITEALNAIEDNDLKQDLRILFLELARRYEKQGKTFGGYLYNYYHYRVENYVTNLMKKKEPYIHMQKELLRIADDLLKDDTSDVDVRDSIFIKAPMMKMEEELDNSWVRGLTCGDEFKDLTPLQRLIIKLNYHDGWTDGKIATKLGTHINTVFRQRTKASKLVKEAVERMKEEKEDE